MMVVVVFRDRNNPPPPTGLPGGPLEISKHYGNIQNPPKNKKLACLFNLSLSFSPSLHLPPHRKPKKPIHLNPHPPTLAQIPLHHISARLEPRSIPLRHGSHLLIHIILAIGASAPLPIDRTTSRSGPGLSIHIPQPTEIQELVVECFFGELVPHAAETACGAGVGAQAPVAIDAHLAGARAACGVADEPAVVVGGCLDADGVLELGDESERGKGAVTRWGGAEDAGGGDVVDGSGEALEDEGGFAEAAAEGESSRVLEADGVWDLAFKGENFMGLLGGGGGAYRIFSRVKAEAFCYLERVGFCDGSAQTFDRWENLLVEIPFYVWFQGGGRGNDVCRCKCSLCRWVRR